MPGQNELSSVGWSTHSCASSSASGVLMASSISMSYQSSDRLNPGAASGRTTTPRVQVAAVSSLRPALPAYVPSVYREACGVSDGSKVVGSMPMPDSSSAQLVSSSPVPLLSSLMSQGATMTSKAAISGAKSSLMLGARTACAYVPRDLTDPT